MKRTCREEDSLDAVANGVERLNPWLKGLERQNKRYAERCEKKEHEGGRGDNGVECLNPWLRTMQRKITTDCSAMQEEVEGDRDAVDGKRVCPGPGERRVKRSNPDAEQEIQAKCRQGTKVMRKKEEREEGGGKR